jgi:hypothetical protein
VNVTIGRKMSQCLLLKAFILGKDQDEAEKGWKGWVYLVELLTINLGWYNIMLGSVRSGTCLGRYQVGRRRISNNKFLTKMMKRGRQSTSNRLGVCTINLQITINLQTIYQSNGRCSDV